MHPTYFEMHYIYGHDITYLNQLETDENPSLDLYIW